MLGLSDVFLLLDSAYVLLAVISQKCGFVLPTASYQGAHTVGLYHTGNINFEHHVKVLPCTASYM